MKKIPVKFKGVVVGWTDENSNSIKFEDTPEAEQLKKDLIVGQNIFISSRAVGKVDESGKVTNKEIFENVILRDNVEDNTKKEE